MSNDKTSLEASYEYKYGFETHIESDQIRKGLNEDVVRLISSKKSEPEWMLDIRLKALILQYRFLSFF